MTILSSLFFLILTVLLSYKNQKSLLIISIFGYITHVIVGIAIVLYIPYSWDIGYFHNTALDLMAGREPNAGSTVSSFAALQAILYRFLGAEVTTIVSLNSFLSILLSFVSTNLAEEMYGDGIQRSLIFFICTFLPAPLFFLTIPMRDALSSTLLFGCLLLSIRIITRDKKESALLILPAVGMLYYLRPELVFVWLIGSACGFSLHIVQTVYSQDISIRTIIRIITIPSLAAIGFISQYISVEEFNARVQYRARGGAAYLDGMSYANLIDVVISAPIRSLYFQLSPFITSINSSYHFLYFLFSFPINFFLLVSSIISVFNHHKEKVPFVVLISTYITGVCGYGVIDSNFGTAARHRAPFTLLLLVISSNIITKYYETIYSTLYIYLSKKLKRRLK